MKKISERTIIKKSIRKRSAVIALVSDPKIAEKYTFTPGAAAYLCSWAIYYNYSENIPNIMTAIPPEEINNKFSTIVPRFKPPNEDSVDRDLAHSTYPSSMLLNILFKYIDVLDIISLRTVSWRYHDKCFDKVKHLYVKSVRQKGYRLSLYKVYKRWLHLYKSPRFLSLLKTNTQFNLMWDFLVRSKPVSYDGFIQRYPDITPFSTQLLSLLHPVVEEENDFVEWVKMYKHVLDLDTAKIVAETLNRSEKFYVPTSLLLFMFQNNYSLNWICFFIEFLYPMTMESLESLLNATRITEAHLAIFKKAFSDRLSDSKITHHILSLADTPSTLHGILKVVPERHGIEVQAVHLELLCSLDEDCFLAFISKFPIFWLNSDTYTKLETKFGARFASKYVSRLDNLVDYNVGGLTNLPAGIPEDAYIDCLFRCLNPNFLVLEDVIRRKYSSVAVKFTVRKLVHLKADKASKNRFVRLAKDYGYDRDLIGFINANVSNYS